MAIEFVGVDGCRGGWFSVGFDGDGGYTYEVFATFGKLLECYADAKLILVDMPIGLPECPGGRNADREARKKLRPRGSTVFPTPTRQTAQHAAESPNDYRAAVAVELESAKKGISKQAFAIAPKIAEVDKLMWTRGKDAKPCVREVHPELCFWGLNGGKPLKFGKKKPEGKTERLRILEGIESQAKNIFDKASTCFPPKKGVARDDILDALAAAVVARRGQGKLQSVPNVPQKDPRGLPMEMVYYLP